MQPFYFVHHTGLNNTLHPVNTVIGCYQYQPSKIALTIATQLIKNKIQPLINIEDEIWYIYYNIDKQKLFKYVITPAEFSIN